MADIQRDAPLFDKLVPIEICNGGDNTRVSHLTFRILAGTRTSVGSNQPEKLFRVEVCFGTFNFQIISVILVFCRSQKKLILTSYITSTSENWTFII